MRSIFNFHFLVDRTRKIAERFSVVFRREASLRTTNYELRTSGGYSLVEVLVAITVLLIALVGPLTIAQSGLKRSYNSREQTMAVFLAQEGLEAVVKVREDNALAAYPDLTSISTTWNTLQTLGSRCTSANPCGVTIPDGGAITDSSFYVCNATNCIMNYLSSAQVPYKQGVGSGTASEYERQIVVEVDNARAAVTSTVTWGDLSSQTVELQTYFYNIYTNVDMEPEGNEEGTPQTVSNVQGDYVGATGPRGLLRDAIAASCSNCNMDSTGEDGSPRNNPVTVARVCVEMFGSSSTVVDTTTGKYDSPQGNYIYTWNGSVWSRQDSSGANNELIKAITCMVY